MTTLDLFSGYSMLVLPILFVAGILLDLAFRREVRNRYPEAWTTFGGTGLLSSGAASNTLRFQRFLWTSAYKTLGDVELNRLAAWLKGLSATYTASFLLMLVALMSQPR